MSLEEPVQRRGIGDVDGFALHAQGRQQCSHSG